MLIGAVLRNDCARSFRSSRIGKDSHYSTIIMHAMLNVDIRAERYRDERDHGEV